MTISEVAFVGTTILAAAIIRMPKGIAIKRFEFAGDGLTLPHL